MENDYSKVIGKLNSLGVRTHFQNPEQLVCAVGIFNNGPFASNSVWITMRRSRWYIVTWSPHGYRIPEGVDVAELCAEILKSSNATIYDVTDVQRAKFGLIEVLETDADSSACYG